MSFKTWCLAIRPDAFLHTVAWRPWASTCSPHGQLCGTHRLKPRRMPTATHTASSSSRRPQLAIGRASSQSPLCGAKDAKNLAFYDGSTKEFSMSARSAWSPGLSQKDCLPGKGSGGGPAEVDQDDKYESRNESVGQGNCASICSTSWRTRVLAAEAKKAGDASEVTRRIPRPPYLIGIEACSH